MNQPISQSKPENKARINQNLQIFLNLMRKEKIDNIHVLAMALANAHVESGGGSILEENLNYTELGLIKTFPHAYTLKNGFAAIDVGNQQAIANRAYSNRLGNRDFESGDGFRFRGRGLIQVTGRYNYEAYFNYAKISKTGSPDLLIISEDAAKSAFWFLFCGNERFKKNASEGNVKACRKFINPALLGLDSVEVWYRHYLMMLSKGQL